MSGMEGKHLWEFNHPYYCSEGNYFRAGMHERFESWADFAQPSELLYDFDDDLNFLFRWDWQRADPEDYRFELEQDPDYALPGDTLLLFFMMQRKARNLSAEVAVTEADEPAVRAWLTARAEKMRQVWAPLLSGLAPIPVAVSS